MIQITPLPNKLIGDIRHILQTARAQAYSTINQTMTQAYWHIGKRIVEEEQQGQQRAEYGTQLLKNLSQALTGELGKGFSYANLANFRQFYLTFPDIEILYTLSRELNWSQISLIMRVDNLKARDYYIQETRTQQWSARQLKRNINTLYYERILSTAPQLSAQTTQDPSDKPPTVHVTDLIKDPYILEFLQLADTSAPQEKDIEAAIISNLSQFLLEAGKGFSFVGRQYRVSTETKHYYIDLVFYNYLLKCFVLIDLKADELTHQDIGQMDTYVRMFDELKRNEDDNPTVGIILCTHKDEMLVKFSVLKDNEQLFASKYRLVLPTEAELIAEIERERRVLGLDGGDDE